MQLDDPRSKIDYQSPIFLYRRFGAALFKIRKQWFGYQRRSLMHLFSDGNKLGNINKLVAKIQKIGFIINCHATLIPLVCSCFAYVKTKSPKPLKKMHFFVGKTLTRISSRIEPI